MTDVAGHLRPGERLIWWGQPGQGVRFGPRDGLLVPFSLLWGGFAVFWETSVWRTGAPAFFRLWGVPFVLVGLYLVAGRFVVDAWLRANTHYAVTDQRVLILRTGRFASFIALRREALPDIRLTECADGSGTIRFGAAAAFSGRMGWSNWTPSLDPTPQLIAIADARAVFDLLQRPMAAAEPRIALDSAGGTE
jgi:hypothetical protein